MNKSSTILKWLLFAGAIYFLAVSIAHMLGFKVPLLFIYYNVPSYGYQDRIISFLSFGWSVFLFSASRDPMKNRSPIKAILIAGLAAVFGLQMINSTTDFSVLSPAIHPKMFEMETFGLISSWRLDLFLFSLNERIRIGNQYILYQTNFHSWQLCNLHLVFCNHLLVRVQHGEPEP